MASLGLTGLLLSLRSLGYPEPNNRPTVRRHVGLSGAKSGAQAKLVALQVQSELLQLNQLADCAGQGTGALCTSGLGARGSVWSLWLSR